SSSTGGRRCPREWGAISSSPTTTARPAGRARSFTHESPAGRPPTRYRWRRSSRPRAGLGALAVPAGAAFGCRGGGYIVKNFDAGEWLGYTISVPTGGNYDIEVRAATNFDFPNSAYHV